MKGLSWPSRLTCSGRFTHIVVTHRLQAECVGQGHFAGERPAFRQLRYAATKQPKHADKAGSNASLACLSSALFQCKSQGRVVTLRNTDLTTTKHAGKAGSNASLACFSSALFQCQSQGRGLSLRETQI